MTFKKGDKIICVVDDHCEILKKGKVYTSGEVTKSLTTVDIGFTSVIRSVRRFVIDTPLARVIYGNPNE